MRMNTWKLALAIAALIVAATVMIHGVLGLMKALGL